MHACSCIDVCQIIMEKKKKKKFDPSHNGYVQCLFIYFWISLSESLLKPAPITIPNTRLIVLN